MSTDETNPQFLSELQEVEEEFQGGYLTELGYKKRRTVLLSKYGLSEDWSRKLSEIQTPTEQPDSNRASFTPNDYARQPSFSGFDAGPLIPPPLSSKHPQQRPPYDTRSATVGTFGQDGTAPPLSSQKSYMDGAEMPMPMNISTGDLSSQPPIDRRASMYSLGPQLVTPGSTGTGSGSGAPSTYDPDRTTTMGTMTPANFAFNPADGPMDYSPDMTTPSRTSTMLDAHQAYFSDFAGQQSLEPREAYGQGGLRYSFNAQVQDPLPPLMTDMQLMGQPVDHLLPLEPRHIPFDIKDPHDPAKLLTSFDNLPTILRYRTRMHPKQTAFWVLDQKGKEMASISWEKLGSRAEKVAQVIRDKSNLYRGGRVALVYRETELIEFAVALLGCFIAGVVAVPINKMDDFHSLSMILTSTQAHLALTTESNLKTFQRDLMLAKQNWPRGVEWWKTNEFGSYHPKKNEGVPPLVVPDLAYIEFSRSPTGDIRGVVLSHRTIMHQMFVIAGIVDSAARSPRSTIRHETVMSYVDPRQSIGLILGVLFPIFHGSTMIWFESAAVETPGLYAHLISKHRATVMVADYPGLKQAALNYQQDPMTTRNFKKNAEPNFSLVKWCFIDTLTVDCEFHEILTDRWFKPLRNPRARDIVAPVLCLPEHGGMVITTRDFFGGEDRLGCSLTHPMNHAKIEAEEHAAATAPLPEEEKKGEGFGSSLIGGHVVVQRNKNTKTDVWEVLLDREALKTNEVVVLAMGEESKRLAPTMPHAIRVGAFGYPIPDATLAVVDPENGVLCTPNVIGEIWVDSPSLSGGFWALPKHTESIFHAKPYRYVEGSPTPVQIEPEFLRTGLLGTVIEGKVYILGMYEDRLRQKVEWQEGGEFQGSEHRYFFVQHLVYSVMKNVAKIYDCSAFDTFVNDEHLPVIVLESWAASTEPLTSGGPPQQLNMALLDSLAERTMEILYAEHHLRVYCVMITAPNTLPRVPKNGRLEIGNMLCRKGFELGSLPCVHVRFGIERSVMNIPFGVDPTGGIWSPMASEHRLRQLGTIEKQYSGVDYREVILDDRTSTPLNTMKSITEIIQWRVSRQGDEVCLCAVDGRGKEGKNITWKKFDTKIAAVALYLRNKVKLKAGDHVVLMYTQSEDYVYAVHACLALGVIALPLAIIDANRLSEDTPALLHIIQDFSVKAILANHDGLEALKMKVVASHLKQSAHVLKVNLPPYFNTSKAPKQSHGTSHHGLVIKEDWLKPERPAFIWTYWTPDQRRLSISISHNTILGMCKVHKETCQITSTKPVLGCVRSSLGLGFIHTCLMGPYVGCTTYLISPVDFASNPVSLFQALARYKVKDTYATTQMLHHAMGKIPGNKGFQLQELKNMMISYEGRPRRDIYQNVRLHFAATGLDRSAISATYSHILNPMITTRAYMCIEPVELWLDPYHLRRGMIYPTDPGTPNTLLLQDSGMVPVSTQIAIVNPESRQLSRAGEFGEIWVRSDACANAFCGHMSDFDAQRFNGYIVDGDPTVCYVRTGDLGFMQTVTRPVGPNGSPAQLQILFVLGPIGETFEVNGLHHFPMDIETTIEACHRNITPGGSAVFQAGGLTVAIVEVKRKAYLASMVPVVLNAVLNEHQIVCDIIAFVACGDFPRSRLGEKQRGKILGTWITRKMRTIAQFSIRDPEIEPRYPPATPERASSLRPATTTETSSLRSMTRAPPVEAAPPSMPQQLPTAGPNLESSPNYQQPMQQQPSSYIPPPDLGPSTIYPEFSQQESMPQQPSNMMPAPDPMARRFSFQTGGEEFDPQTMSAAQDPARRQSQAHSELDSFYADYHDPAYDESTYRDPYDHDPDTAGAIYGAYAYDDDDEDDGAVTPVTEQVRRLQIVNPSMSDDDEEEDSAASNNEAAHH